MCSCHFYSWTFLSWFASVFATTLWMSCSTTQIHQLREGNTTGFLEWLDLFCCGLFVMVLVISNQTHLSSCLSTNVLWCGSSGSWLSWLMWWCSWTLQLLRWDYWDQRGGSISKEMRNSLWARGGFWKVCEKKPNQHFGNERKLKHRKCRQRSQLYTQRPKETVVSWLNWSQRQDPLSLERLICPERRHLASNWRNKGLNHEEQV